MQLAELSSVSSDNTELRRDVDRLTLQLVSLQSDYDRNISSIGGQLLVSKAVNNELSIDISALELQTSVLSSSNMVLQDRLIEIERSLSCELHALKAEIDELKLANADAGTKIDMFSRENLALQGDLGTLRDENAELSSLRNGLLTEKSSLQESVGALTVELAELSSVSSDNTELKRDVDQ